jgi:hypothetical protein
MRHSENEPSVLVRGGAIKNTSKGRFENLGCSKRNKTTCTDIKSAEATQCIAPSPHAAANRTIRSFSAAPVLWQRGTAALQPAHNRGAAARTPRPFAAPLPPATQNARSSNSELTHTTLHSLPLNVCLGVRGLFSARFRRRFGPRGSEICVSVLEFSCKK